jgi:7-cyano-7-deazaguanine synthase
MSPQAVCLFSGGLDSTTVLYAARRDGFSPIALTVSYGQLHAKEIDCARKTAAALAIRHHVISVAMPWGGSALLDNQIPVPTGREESQMNAEIPPTYVPARNSVFLALAASCAEAENAEAIYIGANALDYSGYPDCRPEFLEAFENVIRKGTKAGAEGRSIAVRAPLLRMSKKEIVQLGKDLGVPFSDTWSCYKGGETACGECDSCSLRAKGFREAGVRDPLSYAASPHR